MSYRKSLVALSGVCLAFYVGCGSDDPDVANNVGGAASGNGTGGSGAGGSGGGAATSGSGNGTGSGGGISLDDSGASGGSQNADGGCEQTNIASSLVPANILFVVDRSGSMNCNLPADGQSTADCETHPTKRDVSKPSKWELTKPALQAAITALSVGGTTSVGLSTFPNEGTNCSPPTAPNVTVKPLDAAWASSVNAYLDVVSAGGQTPIIGASVYGYKYMHEKAFTGNKFIVLLTDGFETCAPSQVPGFIDSDPSACAASPAACPVAHAAAVGIRTFVIGVPGSEDGRAVLSQMAYVGGTPRDPSCAHTANPPAAGSAGSDAGDCHYDMTDPSVDFATALSDALAKISGSVLSCEVDVPANPSGGAFDYGKANVTIDNNFVSPTGAQGACAPSADGWQYNDDRSKILLCGAACDSAKTGGSIKVVYGCPTGKIY
ncbi:MAG: VWA domain-containing protein [Sorangiineae bacterium]|nr:VWA domain-containing protein [Polyangiaceae bacterium]MEB2324630.1 VWA domain-containing protein [Sorangiineae bacterium]